MRSAQNPNNDLKIAIRKLIVEAKCLWYSPDEVLAAHRRIAHLSRKLASADSADKNLPQQQEIERIHQDATTADGHLVQFISRVNAVLTEVAGVHPETEALCNAIRTRMEPYQSRATRLYSGSTIDLSQIRRLLNKLLKTLAEQKETQVEVLAQVKLHAQPDQLLKSWTINTKQACSALGVGTRQLHNLVKQGRLQKISRGKILTNSVRTYLSLPPLPERTESQK